MERPAKEGDSPVVERREALVGTRVPQGTSNPAGIWEDHLAKAKYSSSTDSEQVPRGKGEKNPGEGSEIEPETVCLQAVGARCRKAV
jgi:hypothetical protein